MYVISGGNKWWNLDDVFENVGEARTRIALPPGEEIEVANIEKKGRACYQRARQKWDMQMEDLEADEVNKRAGEGRRRAVAAEKEDAGDKSPEFKMLPHNTAAF